MKLEPFLAEILVSENLFNTVVYGALQMHIIMHNHFGGNHISVNYITISFIIRCVLHHCLCDEMKTNMLN